MHRIHITLLSFLIYRPRGGINLNVLLFYNCYCIIGTQLDKTLAMAHPIHLIRYGHCRKSAGA